MFSEEQLARYMERALELAAEAADVDEVPVGALLVQNNQIVGEGRNQREASARTLAHAELIALDDYNTKFRQWRFSPGAALFVTVEPCLMCAGALLWARVDYIFYGCRDSKHAGLERIRPLIQDGTYDHKFKEVRGEILGEKCAGEMSRYFKAKRESRKAFSLGSVGIQPSTE
jgi:tRNA(adenine34) deaminase